MSHTPHALKEDFPDKADQISELCQSDAHFAHLVERYDELNKKVHRVETHVEPMEELAEVQLRKQRAALKDEIWAYLTRAAASASPE